MVGARPGTRVGGAPSDNPAMLPASVASAIKAVLMDLDGTLYHQRPLRWRMLLELGLSPLSAGPRRTAQTFRHLRTFRHVREELRDLGCPEEPLEELQYSKTAERLGDDSQAVRATVLEWMHRRPLRHLPPCLRADLPAFLDAQAERGLELGVFSDYPAPEKLEALGIAERFSLKLCATDSEINAFKPHPRGFERACELWDLQPEQVLYVGDRDEVDGAGARAAGMPVVVLGSDSGAYPSTTDLGEVTRVLQG